MIQDWFENSIFIYIILGICGLGIIVKFVLSMKYRLLIRASKHMGTSKNKLMRVLRLKFETCYKLKLGVNNVDTFVDKYVYRHRFCGLFLYTWETISGEFVILSMLCASVFAVLGLVNECERNDILYTFLTGVLGCALLITYDFFVNFSMKRKVLKTNIKDYLENFLKSRLESDEYSAELLEQYKKEYFDMPGKKGKETKRKNKKNKKEAIPALSVQMESDSIEQKKDEATLRREAKKNELKRMIQADKEKQEEMEKGTTRSEAQIEVRKDMTPEIVQPEEVHKEIVMEEKRKSKLAREEAVKIHEEREVVPEHVTGEVVQEQSIEESAATEEPILVNESSDQGKMIGRTEITAEEAQIIEDILREFLS